ncbi:hypothetical protein PENSPDRAFT_576605 [Peniophora sp. CONT]|nr:hypothetical protein PENSPDRAFT_576605 [Peniophora sp. CONT]
MPVGLSRSHSNSSSPHSRPQSSHGLLPNMDDHLYRPAYPTSARALANDHTRTSSHSSAYSFASTDLQSPADSPPSYTQPKPHLRSSHIRARVAASPYPRDAESVHSSSSETEDISMYLSAPDPADYHAMFAPGPAIHGHDNPPMLQHQHQQGQQQYGRMGGGGMQMGNDHTLEKLAANVRAATTTSASDRAKQIFVQAWLTGNYAPYPDGNVPRQGLYFSYRRVCEQYGIPHINTATLGKAIRHCFPTIKTRRLGVRGNSKYHYCGIRPATSAEAEFLQDYIRKSNNTAAQQSVNAARIASEQAETGGYKNEDRSDEEDEDDISEAPSSKRNSFALPLAPAPSHPHPEDKTPTAATLLAHAQAAPRPGAFPAQAAIRRHPGPHGQEMPIAIQPAPPQHPQFAAPPPAPSSTVRQLPHFPSIEEALGGANANPSNSAHAVAAREVWSWFADHLDALLESVRYSRFDQFEMHVRSFWSNLQGTHREIVHAPAIAGLMAKGDAIVYDEILEILRSQLLSTISPPALASLRGLADKMEKILLVALEGYGNTFVEPKVELGARFGHLVLRFLDIYQVTQALSTVLMNQKQVADMRRSWDKIDFESVRNQSALVCNCRHEDLVQLLEVEFRTLLDTVQKSAEPAREVMAWADKCCERLMSGTHGGPGEERGSMSSRSVLIRWGYVTSQVMRDLTIRSDPTFGAFQILKLFLDDWIGLNVLRNVALSTTSVAASVEPMMQQHFSGLSPMMGQEPFYAGPSGMGQTPTSSSMLAALQHEPYGDPGAAAFNPENYGLPSYLDGPGGSTDDPLAAHHGLGAFGEYAPGPFDVSGFVPHDLGLGTGTPGREPDALPETAGTPDVKAEGSS